MSETYILGIAILIIWVAVVYLRVPATVLFLSILLGKLFAEELTLVAYDVVSGTVPGLTTTTVQAGLLLLPVILTIVFSKGATSRSRILLNAIPLLFCLVTLGLFVNPYFDVVSRLDEQQRIILTNNQSYVVALSGLAVLLNAWFFKDKTSITHKKRK